MKILFLQDNNRIALIFAALNSPIEHLLLAVPYQRPYFIIDETDLPADHTFFDAWEMDFSNPDGYGIGPQRWFIEQAEKAILDGIDIEENTELIARMKDEIFQIEGVRI